MLRSQALVVLWISGLLACSADAPGPQDAPPATPAVPSPAPTSATATVGVSPPPGFIAMDDEGVQRLRAATLRGTATEAELEAWVAPQGAATGLVVAMNVRHAVNEPVYGNTLQTWVRHNLRAIQDGLAALDAEAQAPRIEDDPAFAYAVLTRYALPLPGGGSLRVQARHWLSADGHLVESSCQCAGTGCTEPPACTLPPAPTTALAAGAVLGIAASASTLTTASGEGRVQAPPHLSALPAAAQAQLESSAPGENPRRSGARVQALHAADGSGVVLTEATWCEEPPACDAQTLAENRRKAEVDSLRRGGTLRSVETHADPHGAVPMYGFEIDQHDGFWTRTAFWSEAGAVREVSCACAGLACALAQRTCTFEPNAPSTATARRP